MRKPVALLAAGAALASAGCGGGDGGGEPAAGGERGAAFQRKLELAQHPGAADFPATRGRTLQRIADRVTRVQAGLASSEFTPGPNRLAFGVIGKDNKLVYGPSAVYLAPTPNDPAEGPFPAPADPLVVDPPFRSKQAALESDAIAAIYETDVELARPGRYAVLVVTKTPDGQLVGGGTEITVRRSSPIPAVGERPPRVKTETIASSGGDIESIETRDPADDMHEENFADVVGQKPVALLMATPALCQTRVCGPVTDIAAQFQKEYGDRMTFIHQEVYEDNDVQKGLRAPLREFGLRTEPWLFTFGADGRVAARLEGSFGNRAFRRAVEAALD
ncbi:MAG: hypothetical protein QOE60_1522 [Thermoleophilaceae bacterium]|nr:hypothetical protein [Thermoleophilaceae bacterium]